MKLVIFDIDGTLTRTSAVDDACYIRACEEEFGIKGISTDWGSYEHSTDTAIANDILRAHTGRRDVADLAERLRRRFVQLLRATLEADPGQFSPTQGVHELLKMLPEAGWTVAIATGAWRDSAETKLRAAGLLSLNLPAAFSDDSISREGIILTAAQRAGLQHETRQASIVYVGDGRWDVLAARNLGIGFIGVAQGDRARLLHAHGADVVVTDFLDIAGFLTVLRQQAEVRTGF